MPRIIVVADTPSDDQHRPVMFTERVNSSDFESGHFRTQLAERLGWAVADAHDIERERPLEPARGDEPHGVVMTAESELDHQEPVEFERRELSPALG